MNNVFERNQAFHDAWDKKTIRIGFWSLLIACAASFAPPILLWLIWGIIPPIGTLFEAWKLILLAYGAFHIIEPISYYSVYGLSGTYMSFLSGNNSNMRVPAASTAQDILGIEPGTDKAEIVTTLAIAGSVIVNLVVLFIGIVFGAQIVAHIPENIKNGLSNYILPTMFGALYATMAVKDKYMAVVCLVLCIVAKLIGLPSWAFLIIAVFGSIGASRILYVKGIIK
jgi:hypothetical protein